MRQGYSRIYRGFKPKPLLHDNRPPAMADKLFEVLVVREMPYGTFAAADALQRLRIVQHGLKMPLSQRTLSRISIWLAASSGDLNRKTDQQCWAMLALWHHLAYGWGLEILGC
jgi:hypothetical protein